MIEAVPVDLARLGLDRGAHVILAAALIQAGEGQRVAVFGDDENLALHVRAWARTRGHGFEPAGPADILAAGTSISGARLVGWLAQGTASSSRWRDAQRATGQSIDPAQGPDAIAEHPPATWGLAARGAAVEAGGPQFRFPLADKDRIWADEAASLYAQALSCQWDPAQVIPWDAPLDHPDGIEDALVQILTFLIENETAALIIPARFASQIHPHFREVQQLLAIQAADEARHIEVFTRRARLRRTELGLSTAGGQESLRTLVEEPDFELASLLLSVLGEGTFVNLLWFIHRHAPDECTRTIMKLTAQDEARHVAFGVAHLARHASLEPELLDRMASAIERRHGVLRDTAGLNEEVFDSLVLLAAGSLEPEAIARGHAAVVDLNQQMHQGRLQRLRLLGFDKERAAALSELHTRNFM